MNMVPNVDTMVPNGFGLGLAPSAPGDILTQLGTPPVASHSMVRRLFGGYTGNLFQVRRVSDSATLDIGTGLDGWVNLTALLTFLGSSSGTVAKIYDQSGNGNTFTQATAANQGTLSFRYLQSGRQIPVVTCASGQLYRNLTLGTGIPTGTNPIMCYAVITNELATKPTIGFYGNLPLTVADIGSGTMFSLAWGITGGVGGAGDGPWLGVDWENGIFNYVTAFPAPPFSPPPQLSDFIFELSKSNGSTRWVIKGGSATSPIINTLYDGALPSGYTQNLQGGIGLNTGADGSSGGIEFVEGIMCAAFTADAADAGIQTNLAYTYGADGALLQYPGYLKTASPIVLQATDWTTQTAGVGIPPQGGLRYVNEVARTGWALFGSTSNPTPVFYPTTTGQITQLQSITTQTGSDGGGYLNAGYAAFNNDLVRAPTAAVVGAAMGISHDIGGGVLYNVTYNSATQLPFFFGMFNGGTGTFTKSFQINIDCSLLFTGTPITINTGGTNPILIGPSGSATYNSLSFNNTNVTANMIGFAAGGGTDGYLYSFVPANGGWQFQTANTKVLDYNQSHAGTWTINTNTVSGFYINSSNTGNAGFWLDDTAGGGKQFLQYATGSTNFEGAGHWGVYDQTDNRTAIDAYYNGTNGILQLPADALFGFNPNSAATNSSNPDTCLYRNAAGAFEINSGTVGTFRDLVLRDIFTNDATFLHRTKTTLTNSASTNTATLTNAPVTGNPTKWFSIDDNGTTRRIPAW